MKKAFSIMGVNASYSWTVKLGRQRLERAKHRRYRRRMRVWAISDIHIDRRDNKEAFLSMQAHPEDWLILAGDTGETHEDLGVAIDIAAAKFAKVIWVPGNHELWTTPNATGRDALRGQARYESMVALCRSRNVATPEDPFLSWGAKPQKTILAPLFLLYDYSFRPNNVSEAEVVAWAQASGICAQDEKYLFTDPYLRQILPHPDASFKLPPLAFLAKKP